MTRVAINGLGRIGRTTFRQLLNRNDVQIVAVNDLQQIDVLHNLLTRDSVYGRIEHELTVDGETFKVGAHTIEVLSQREPSKLPWKRLDVDVVLDCTGLYKSYEQAHQHIDSGAKRVLLSYPVGDDRVKNVVKGVNDSIITADDKIISNASCTTNCASPVIKVLQENWGIEKGVLNTIHAYTADQKINDSAHKDLRRARAAAVNIIPTSTGAAKAVGRIFPELKGMISGSAYRVPVITGSCVDLTVALNKSFTVEEVNAALKEAANGSLKGILQYSTEALVSTDIVASSYSSIFDSDLTTDANGWLRIVSWYDNEFGYSTRMAEMCAML